MKDIVEDIINNMDRFVTVILAIWGSTLSTIIYLNDKPRVKIGIGFGYGLTKNDNSRYLVCSIINYGRRPITIVNMVFEADGKTVTIVLPDQFYKWELPKKLLENEDHSVVMDYELLQRKLNESKSRPIKKIVFIDNLGKKHKKKLDKKQFIKITNEAALKKTNYSNSK